MHTTKDVLWETRYMERIPVSRMARTHIKHSLAIMKRTPYWRKRFKARLELELRVRELTGRED